MKAAGSAKTNPASGPAMPMSNNARREGIGDLILMTAPKVPTRKRKRNEVGQRRAHAVPPAGDVMPHLMRPEDGKHCERIDRAFNKAAEHDKSNRERRRQDRQAEQKQVKQQTADGDLVGFGPGFLRRRLRKVFRWIVDGRRTIVFRRPVFIRMIHMIYEKLGRTPPSRRRAAPLIRAIF